MSYWLNIKINLKNNFLVEHNDQFEKISFWLNIMINLKNVFFLVKHYDQFEKCLFG